MTLRLWLLRLLGLRLWLRLRLFRPLLRPWLGWLERRLGLLRLRLKRPGSSAESSPRTAHIAAAGVDRPREMIRQAQPAGRNYDEKLGILKRVAF